MLTKPMKNEFHEMTTLFPKNPDATPLWRKTYSFIVLSYNERPKLSTVISPNLSIHEFPLLIKTNTKKEANNYAHDVEGINQLRFSEYPH
jgi:hypothetical protein